MNRRTPWIAGPDADTAQSVHVSVTAFTANRWRDMPGIYVAGMRLRREWPRMRGAVGMWLWADPLHRRSGSVSVWSSEDDLGRFVRWPVHVAIMRRYRVRGSVVATSFGADRFVRSDVLSQALRWIEGTP